MINNVFCTLAIGPKYVEYTKFLAADLGGYKVPLVVMTDHPGEFRKFPYVHVIEHKPKEWFFHDKRLPLQEALKIGETAIFVDADSMIWFGADRREVRQALAYNFPPGLHAQRLFPADYYHYPHLEKIAKEWGFKFNREIISYWEALFALRKCKEVDSFFAHWEKFVEEARQTGTNGYGEGTAFGIAAEASGLRKHYTTYMVESKLGYIFWHARLRFNRRKMYHMKFALKEMFSGNFSLQQQCWGR
jgi:hypothetical protein